MIIAIDGPAGSGKSSTARAVAARLGFVHLDTGAMYRAITLKALREEIPFTNDDALGALMARTEIRFTGTPPETMVWMDDEDVTSAVRGDKVTRNVSDYCARSMVREALVNRQRHIAENVSCVCEGRDIGTVVFPNADIKFFMVASVEERARRRMSDFDTLGVAKTLEELAAEIRERDRKDSSRPISPLRKADDAIELDTTGMTFENQVEQIVACALSRGAGTVSK